MNERFLKADREWVDEHLEAYLDGELNGPDTERMERTLETSPELTRELELARRIHEDLAATPDYRCPPVVSRQVFAHVSTQGSTRTARVETRESWWSSLLPTPAWGMAGLAATVLLAAGLWFVLPQFAGEEEFIVIDGQRYTAAEIAQARADLELAMAYVDHMSDQINKQVSPYVSGESMLESVNIGLDKGAANAREALGKMYQDES